MGRPLTAIMLATDSRLVQQSSEALALRRLCGRSLLLWGLDTLRDIPLQKTVVVTDQRADMIAKELQDQGADMFVDYVEQRVPRGTGDATSVGLTALPTDHAEGLVEADVLVMPAWLPLLDSGHLQDLVEAHRANNATCTLLTMEVPDPEGCTRVVRDQRDRIARLQPDNLIDRQTRLDEVGFDSVEIFTDIMICRVGELGPALRRVAPTAFDGDYSHAGVVRVLADAGFTIASHSARNDIEQITPTADTLALSQAETTLRANIITKWLKRGVHIVDPRQTWIDGAVQLSPGVTVAPGTILQGQTVVAVGATVGPHTQLVDCMVGARAVVAHTVGVDAEIGPSAVVGPWAHLGPGASVGEGEDTGPFYTEN